MQAPMYGSVVLVLRLLTLGMPKVGLMVAGAAAMHGGTRSPGGAGCRVGRCGDLAGGAQSGQGKKKLLEDDFQ